MSLIMTLVIAAFVITTTAAMILLTQYAIATSLEDALRATRGAIDTVQNLPPNCEVTNTTASRPNSSNLTFDMNVKCK